MSSELPPDGLPNGSRSRPAGPGLHPELDGVVFAGAIARVPQASAAHTPPVMIASARSRGEITGSSSPKLLGRIEASEVLGRSITCQSAQSAAPFSRVVCVNASGLMDMSIPIRIRNPLEGPVRLSRQKLLRAANRPCYEDCEAMATIRLATTPATKLHIASQI